MTTKTCPRCEQKLDLSNFRMRNPDRYGRVYPQPYCKPCTNKYQKERRDAKIAAGTFVKRPRTDAQREKERAAARKTNLKKYGITEEEYDALVTLQGGCCAICKSTSPWSRSQVWHIDHCHSTGKVRGLLCSNCNRALGQFQDNLDSLRAAIEYLENNPYDSI